MRRRRAALLLLPAVLLGCPSLAALNPSDAGEEVGGMDASSDRVGAPDRAGTDATDAPMDAAADAGACVFIDADFAAAQPHLDAGCALSDGSTCAPEWDPQYASYIDLPPPRNHTASCTSMQIQAFLNACPLPFDSSTGACHSWFSDPGNTACAVCAAPTIIGQGGTAGPVLLTPYGAVENNGYNNEGCIELVDPCNTPCAKALWTAIQCNINACDPVCPPNSTAYGSCTTAADSCLCAGGEAVFNDCFNSLQAGGGPGASCLVPTGVLVAFCGM